MRKPSATLTRLTRLGLMSLCLSLFLMGCESQPKLQTVYVSVPVTADLSLLCNPQAPLPPATADNGRLDLYTKEVHDAIGECRKQQEAYKAEVNRLMNRAKRRAPQ